MFNGFAFAEGRAEEIFTAFVNVPLRVHGPEVGSVGLERLLDEIVKGDHGVVNSRKGLAPVKALTLAQESQYRAAVGAYSAKASAFACLSLGVLRE